MKQDIRKLTADQIKDWFVRHGEPGFRAKQVHEWLWKKSALSFGHMTNLSLPTRELLNTYFEIRPLTVDQQQRSNDGTIKSSFRLYDGNLVEGVLIPSLRRSDRSAGAGPHDDRDAGPTNRTAGPRMTACVSSQVGCSLTCKFCATGYMDRKRNLDAAEIYDQVVAIDRQAKENYDAPLSNIVYMGMGEPLLNYKNVLESVDRITSADGLGMSPKRITVSTAGIAKMIRQLGDDAVKFNLALSLHAANDTKRDQIMPINESNTLAVLGDALTYFYQKTGTRITFEYILFYNFNDTLQDAEELWKFTKRVPAKINIIEYNPIAEANFTNTDPQTLDRFAGFLESKGVTINVRRSRGKDIDAACGQLAGKQTVISEQ